MAFQTDRVEIDPAKLRVVVEEVVEAYCRRAINHHIEAVIEAAKDEATKAIAKRLLELVVKEQLEKK